MGTPFSLSPPNFYTSSSVSLGLILGRTPWGLGLKLGDLTSLDVRRGTTTNTRVLVCHPDVHVSTGFGKALLGLR